MSLQFIKNIWKPSYVSQQVIPAGYIFSSRPSSSTESTNNNNDGIVEMPNPYEREKPKCVLCRLNIHPNYKNVRLLSQFQSPYTGRIYGRHITGLCQLKQFQLEKEIQKSQRAGFMGSYHKSVDFLKDPKLFDPERPLRPHPH